MNEYTDRELIALGAIFVVALSSIAWVAERADRRDPWRARPSRYQAHPIALSRLGLVGIVAILTLVVIGTIGQALRRVGIL